MDAERARDVVRRRHDAPAVRVAADDERLLAEPGVLELLDRREEGVEVEVGQDRRRGRHHAEASRDVLRADGREAGDSTGFAGASHRR